MEILRRTLKAYVISIVVFVALTFILAAIISFTGFKEEWTFGALIFIMSLTSFLTGLLEGGIVGKRGLLVGTAAGGLLVFIILIAAGGIFADSFGSESFSVFYIIPVITGAVGGVAGTNFAKV